MKTAQSFHVYIAGNLDPAVVAGAGLESEVLVDPGLVEKPALVLLGPNETAPAGLADISFAVPAGTSPNALREFARIAMEVVDLRSQLADLEEQARRQHRQFEDLNRIGIALSGERDIARLRELILTTMRQLTGADGASLWLKREDEDGRPVLFLAESQNHSIDRDTYSAFTVPADEKTVVGYAVSKGMSLMYEDAYNPPPGMPRGGKGFDERFGYRTKSMLTVPLRNHTGEVVGAVQLINAKRDFETRLTPDTVDQDTVTFRPQDLEMIESIASQAAVALDNKILLNKTQDLLAQIQELLTQIQNMFDGFVKASVAAIEQRDPTTAGHSGRVEKLTSLLARTVSDIATGRYRDVHFTEDQFKELRYACLLHDFGKIGVREHILVKAKKLREGQLEVIQARFEAVERALQAKYAEEKFESFRNGDSDAALAEIDARMQADLDRLDRWIQAIIAANEPTVMPEDKASMLAGLERETYVDMAGRAHPLLGPDEFRFLSILKGTLDDEERLKIQEHVQHSYDFLREIPWTAVMKDIPEIAYGHHEKLDGSGYPRRLRGDQIPIQARMMTISDIYDALTAANRPYKPAVPTEVALDILHGEAAKGQLDEDLLDIFVTARVYEATPAAR